MSISLMSKVWELQSLSQPRKMLLLSIADFASDEGLAWPGVKTLMRKCSLKSESGTRRAINELVELGWLSKKERPSKVRKGKHQQDTNLYQINLSKLYDEASQYEPVHRTPSKQHDYEHAQCDGSPCDGSQYEGSPDDKKHDYEPVPRTPDPSLNKKQDPSDKKILCQLAAQTDPEVLITDQAKAVLKHLNLVTGSRYQASKSSLGKIRARLSEGFTAEQLVLTVDYMTEKWGGDLNMSDYLRPSTLFGPEKFPGYQCSSEAWAEQGRPARVNGKWQIKTNHRVTPATGVIPPGFSNGVSNSGGDHDGIVN